MKDIKKELARLLSLGYYDLAMELEELNDINAMARQNNSGAALRP